MVDLKILLNIWHTIVTEARTISISNCISRSWLNKSLLCFFSVSSSRVWLKRESFYSLNRERIICAANCTQILVSIVVTKAPLKNPTTLCVTCNCRATVNSVSCVGVVTTLVLMFWNYIPRFPSPKKEITTRGRTSSFHEFYFVLSRVFSFFGRMQPFYSVGISQVSPGFLGFYTMETLPSVASVVCSLLGKWLFVSF